MAESTPGQASVALALARASVRGFTASPAGNLLRMAGAGMLILSESLGVIFLLDRVGTIGGWTTSEVLLLVGIADAGLGLGMLIAEGFEPPVFSQALREGRFDQVLTRPLSPWLWVAASDVQVRYLGRVITGTALAGVALHTAHVAVTPVSWLVLLGAVVAMGIVVAALLTIGAAITMWTIEGTELLNAFTYGGALLTGWPMQIYAGGLRAIFIWIVPVGAAVYVPALWILDREGPAGAERWMLAIVPLLVGGFVAAAAGAWVAGLRRYSGAGA